MISSLAAACRDASRILRTLEDTARALEKAIAEGRDLEARVAGQQDTPPAPPKLMLTVDEAAAEIGVSRVSIYQLIRSGALTSVKIGNRRRIRREDLTAYVAGLRADRPS